MDDIETRLRAVPLTCICVYKTLHSATNDGTCPVPAADYPALAAVVQGMLDDLATKIADEEIATLQTALAEQAQEYEGQLDDILQTRGLVAGLRKENGNLRATLAEQAREVETLKADLQVAHDIGDSFWLAIKPLNLQRINVSNPGAHVTELIQEIERLTTAINEKLDTAVAADFETLSTLMTEKNMEIERLQKAERVAETERIARGAQDVVKVHTDLCETCATSLECEHLEALCDAVEWASDAHEAALGQWEVYRAALRATPEAGG